MCADSLRHFLARNRSMNPDLGTFLSIMADPGEQKTHQLSRRRRGQHEFVNLTIGELKLAADSLGGTESQFSAPSAGVTHPAQRS
jgi:hypothetical protein